MSSECDLAHKMCGPHYRLKAVNQSNRNFFWDTLYIKGFYTALYSSVGDGVGWQIHIFTYKKKFKIKKISNYFIKK